MAWLARKALAFIPLTRSNVPSDVPTPDWTDQIMQRVFFDPFWYLIFQLRDLLTPRQGMHP